jgi:hypothetical protein
MSMEHKFRLTELQLKTAINNYIMKQTNGEFDLRYKGKILFQNGSVEEKCLFTDVVVYCKKSSEYEGGIS